MKVVLCDTHDAGGLWLASRLDGADEKCVLVTSELLSFARRRSQRLGRGGVQARVDLHDDAAIQAPSLVVNRLLSPPIAAWQQAEASERHYATAELTAFTLSWLAGLEAPVRNRADPSCLAGPAPHWLLTGIVAARAGLDCPDLTEIDHRSPYPLLEQALRAAGSGGRPVHAVVLDGLIIDPEGVAVRAGRALPAELTTAVRTFAEDAGAAEALIGIDLVVDDAHWWFGGLTPLPDVRLAGDALVRSLGTLAACGGGSASATGRAAA